MPGLPILGLLHQQCQGRMADTRHVWQDAHKCYDASRLTIWGKAGYKRRKKTVERSFADAKQLFSQRSARFHTLARLRCQCLLTTAAQNIKKIAILLTRTTIQSLA